MVRPRPISRHRCLKSCSRPLPNAAAVRGRFDASVTLAPAARSPPRLRHSSNARRRPQPPRRRLHGPQRHPAHSRPPRPRPARVPPAPAAHALDRWSGASHLPHKTRRTHQRTSLPRQPAAALSLTATVTHRGAWPPAAAECVAVATSKTPHQSLRVVRSRSVHAPDRRRLHRRIRGSQHPRRRARLSRRLLRKRSLRRHTTLETGRTWP